MTFNSFLRLTKIQAKKSLKFKFKLATIFFAYFAFKFILFFMSLSNFSILDNFIFFLFTLVFPCKKRVRIPYHVLLVLIAIILLYKDSYLPSIDFAINQSGSLMSAIKESKDYIADYFNFRIIVIFVGVFAFSFFLMDVFHFEFVIFVLFAYVTFATFNSNLIANELATKNTEVTEIKSDDIPEQKGEPNTQNIENYLQTFLAKEKQRIVSMPQTLPLGFEPFDIVVLNICSFASDDVVASNLADHEVFSKFDAKFDNFNSASSYSTPASMRLLRANCGQESESDMYSQRRTECELLTSLDRLGFSNQVYLDHNGIYGDYFKTLHDQAGLIDKMYPLNKLSVKYTAFDGTAVYSDFDLFKAYINNMETNINGQKITFFNILSLHDGNRLYGQTKSQPYVPRLRTLLDDIDVFMSDLENSQRKTLFIMVPEHGAAIRGDKMQIAKLREIPTDTITRIPTMIKFFGIKNESDKKHEIADIKGSFSYLALAEIIKRSIEGNVFAKDKTGANVKNLIEDLPQTAFIGESTNAFFMKFQNKDFYKLKGDHWEPYKK